jgi:hypothetical protein
MQSPTSSQERDKLCIVISLTATAPKQLANDERRSLSIEHLFKSRCAMDSRFAVKARKKQEMNYNGGVSVEVI